MEKTSDKWEFSLLVDQASKILEARGMVEVYLGGRSNQVIGRPLLSYFDAAEKLPFLRYMARLLVRGEAEPVSATLRTPGAGIKRFAMAAKAGDAGRSWWILFSQEVKDLAEVLKLESGPQAFASEQELDLVARAHDHATAPLDITVFRARAVSDDATALSPEKRKEIDAELSRTLMDHARDGMVSHPAVGEYAMLHDRGTDASTIRDQLAAVAANHNLQPDDLGIEHETVRLDPGVGAAEAIRNMRSKMQDRDNLQYAAPAVVPPRSRMPLYVAAAAGIAIVAVGTFFLLHGA
jgi:hypothetical protein